ncbi:40S ribosomal protein S8 [Culex quinquefasciatus]|uniref:40S ribosomal protein S8 n=1 Tax=Culex quinquefasciatus TaxID=7176 RepID=B0XC91_CULQU|nr:40S ribosomal protein S8 [Culex quinquefasciatus]|eukprot:XP_001867263.1 40S ribosomal protein S8 [Culex quinquefasciatus]
MLPQGTYHPRITYNLYNASNNELVRTKKLFKNAITVIDVAPFRRWYESLLPEGKRGGCVGQEGLLDLLKKYAKRQKTAKMYPDLEVQPGQSGRVDGCLLEGKVLEFYNKKNKKSK